VLPSVMSRSGRHPAAQRSIVERDGGRLPDRLEPGIEVLFVGINPGMRSAALGHHFAGHSNRFWKLLREVGLVPEDIGYEQDAELPRFGLGLTNLVERATPGVADLDPADYAEGRERLLGVIQRVQPYIVALVGVTVYRKLFDWRDDVRLGMQADVVHGARVFVVPNPSGRNAHHSYEAMREAFGELRVQMQARRRDRGGPARRPRPRQASRPRGVARRRRPG
jgi:double-stranded uracil-DNA glycosylase